MAFTALPAGATTWVVDQNHPRADDAGTGNADSPFRTIAQAAWVAEPGDTVLVHGGVYRERVAPRRGGEPGQPITYQAVPGEKVVIRASDPIDADWQPVEGHPELVYAALDAALFAIDQRHAEDWPNVDFPASYNPFALAMTSATQPRQDAVDPYGNPVDADQDTPRTERLTIGQVFVNGEPLLQVQNREQAAELPGSFCVDGKGKGLFVHFAVSQNNPAGRLVEASTRPRCFAPYRRGLGHITVRGFVMEHAAADFHRGFYQPHGSPQAGLLSTRGGHHWVIEHNTLRLGATLGLDLGREGNQDADRLGQPEPESTGDHVVRFNVITDNGAGGIHGLGSYRTVIAHNRIERNNRLGFRAPEIGAIKLHFFIDGVIEHNLIRDNDCFGIWLDNIWHRARVHGNLLLNNQGAGLFMEMGHGPALIDHNIVAHTRAGSSTSGTGDGVYAHDASGITFAHNFVGFNAGHGLFTHRATDREPWVFRNGERVEERRTSASSAWQITGNMFLGNALAAVALPPVDPSSKNNHCDHNVYAGQFPRQTGETFAANLGPVTFAVPTNKGRTALSSIREAAQLGDDEPCTHLTLAQWRDATGFDTHSREVTVLRPVLGSQTPTLALIAGTDFLEVRPPANDRLTTDYFATPRQGPAVAGPFARVTVDPRVQPAESMPAEEWIEGRGPFNKIDDRAGNVWWLWPKPAATLE